MSLLANKSPGDSLTIEHHPLRGGTYTLTVHHRYCGQLGKQANCQVAVTLSIARQCRSPIGCTCRGRGQTTDRAAPRRMCRARSGSRPSQQLPLEQIRAAVKAKVARGAVLMDAGYGTNSGLRRAITGLGLGYVAAIISTVKVRPVREGHPRQKRVSVEALASSLPKHAWRTFTWRETIQSKRNCMAGAAYARRLPDALPQRQSVPARMSHPVRKSLVSVQLILIAIRPASPSSQPVRLE